MYTLCGCAVPDVFKRRDHCEYHKEVLSMGYNERDIDYELALINELHKSGSITAEEASYLRSTV